MTSTSNNGPSARRIAAAAIAGTLVLGAPSVAGAQEAPPAEEPGERHRDIERLRDRCQKAIDQRIGHLATATARLDAAAHLIEDHEAALDGEIAETVRGLTALSAKIEVEDDPRDLAALCHDIATEFRVYALVIPKARLVTGADTAVFLGGELNAIADRLQEKVDEAAAHGEDVAEAQAALDHMRVEIDAALGVAGPVPDGILGLTPADWNADQTVLDPAREAVRSAKQDLADARALGHEVARLLKGGSGGTATES